MQTRITTMFIYGIFITLVLAIGAFFVSYKDLHYGGDIIEYYGTAHSILRHGTPNLTPSDEKEIKTLLNPAYLKDPLNYMTGKDGQRYSVHFPFYSLLTVPMLLLLRLLAGNPLDALRLTNLVLFTFFTLFALHRYNLSLSKKVVLLLILLLSPLISFLIWPGPDVYYAGLLLLSVFAFFERKYLEATFFASFASWQSQPLIVFTAGFVLFYLCSKLSFHGPKRLFERPFVLTLLPLFVSAIPYVYNYFVFGMWTPWISLKDGHTLLYGFGIHNASLQKLYEMFFDLNMGLFWYAPVLFAAGVYFIFLCATAHYDKLTKSHTIVTVLLTFTTAMLYQTNPAWNYGTAGYGPTRHVLFILSLLVLFFVREWRPMRTHVTILLLYGITQISILSFNGFLTPNFMNVLQHTPYAEFVLSNYPWLYNPTPEIFVDRTNHTDMILTTSVYKKGGMCKKAYVSVNDMQKLIDACGYVPNVYKERFTNEHLLRSAYPRRLRTAEATFWPDPKSCDRDNPQSPFVCMKKLGEVVGYTGVSEKERLQPLGYPGAWRLTWGKPVSLTVPPGYIVDYYALEGFFVNYE